LCAQLGGQLVAVVVEEREEFESGETPVDLAEILRTHRVSALAGVPTMFRTLLDLPHDDLRAATADLRLCTSGGAPLPPAWLAAFREATGLAIVEGYGLTEAGPVVTTNPLGAPPKPGSVGRALPGVEIKIAEEDGEILLRGPNVFNKYWDNAQATSETLIDGWLHTGDVGELDDEGYLTITGRKKDIIITAGGKNLTPANLENDLQQTRFISQAMMHGDRRPYPVALITLDEEEIVPWASEQGLPGDVAELASSEEVRRLVQEELDRANAQYASVEQIKKFAILERELSIEDGELTPTLKIKRAVVNEKYADVLDSLYGGG